MSKQKVQQDATSDKSCGQSSNFINQICGAQIPRSVENCLQELNCTGDEETDAKALAQLHCLHYPGIKYFQKAGLTLWIKYINIFYQRRGQLYNQSSTCANMRSAKELDICSDTDLPPAVNKCREGSRASQKGDTGVRRAQTSFSYPEIQDMLRTVQACLQMLDLTGDKDADAKALALLHNSLFPKQIGFFNQHAQLMFWGLYIDQAYQQKGIRFILDNIEQINALKQSGQLRNVNSGLSRKEFRQLDLEYEFDHAADVDRKHLTEEQFRSIHGDKYIY